MTGIPLFAHSNLDAVFAWNTDGPVSVGDYLADVRWLSEQLPAAGHLLNLCHDRYRFAVGFAAGLLRGMTSLQPSSQSAETFTRLQAEHPDLVCLCDGPSETLGLPRIDFPAIPTLRVRPQTSLTGDLTIPQISADHLAAILFTSGSTGLPQAQRKTWGKLVANGCAEAIALGLDRQPHAIVGTVPVQHSYGFESTFLLALHGGCAFWSGKPFYPQDIASALDAVPQPRLLVTTPFHLSALLSAGIDLPPVDKLLSATAALSTALASEAERRTGAPMLEIYGSTESGQLATRRTTEGAAWTLLPGVRLRQDGDETIACDGHVEGCVALSDLIELLPDRRFLLHGRQADLINIAGKRTSLAYLNHQLGAIPGVVDGAFFLPDDEDPDGITRLTAFVVAPDLSARQVTLALRQRIDALFLPRPLVLVDTLPRNSTGKLPRSELQALYADKVSHDGR
ncbi:AMP-binding protein [Dechloromonas sp. HYN0024]|uniref:AMP-binding protein n=1 Tax=Dechloromonas sp. HYN0024 TaxID=2231055 RepID=UPI000E447367|nr:AMP-binding protein [Dechloromonas sp. HYN0024]AXS81328.1 beta-hydroxyacyl-ACP dehydratase [Dechloromonas sp. HYN0024]